MPKPQPIKRFFIATVSVIALMPLTSLPFLIASALVRYVLLGNN